MSTPGDFGIVEVFIGCDAALFTLAIANLSSS
jgi:hypothetical protein